MAKLDNRNTIPGVPINSHMNNRHNKFNRFPGMGLYEYNVVYGRRNYIVSHTQHTVDIMRAGKYTNIYLL